MLDNDDVGGESLPPHDTGGCFLVVFRAGCGMAILQLLMALAILLAAVFSLFLFR